MPSESEGSIHDRGGGKSSATDERLVPLGSTGDNSRQRYKAPRVCESSVGEWRERSSLGPTSDDKEMHQPCTAHAYQGITFSDAAPLRMRAIHLKRGATLSRLEHTRPPLLQPIHSRQLTGCTNVSHIGFPGVSFLVVCLQPQLAPARLCHGRLKVVEAHLGLLRR